MDGEHGDWYADRWKTGIAGDLEAAASRSPKGSGPEDPQVGLVSVVVHVVVPGSRCRRIHECEGFSKRPRPCRSTKRNRLVHKRRVEARMYSSSALVSHHGEVQPVPL